MRDSHCGGLNECGLGGDNNGTVQCAISPNIIIVCREVDSSSDLTRFRVFSGKVNNFKDRSFGIKQPSSVITTGVTPSTCLYHGRWHQSYIWFRGLSQTTTDMTFQDWCTVLGFHGVFTAHLLQSMETGIPLAFSEKQVSCLVKRAASCKFTERFQVFSLSSPYFSSSV